MSLRGWYLRLRRVSFPRVSGDEPTVPVRIVDVAGFSPRERG